MSDFHIPEDLEEMVKELVAIEELEKMAEEIDEDEFERERLRIEEFIDELKKADYIDPDLWKREITI